MASSRWPPFLGSLDSCTAVPWHTVCPQRRTVTTKNSLLCPLSGFSSLLFPAFTLRDLSGHLPASVAHCVCELPLPVLCHSAWQHCLHSCACAFPTVALVALCNQGKCRFKNIHSCFSGAFFFAAVYFLTNGKQVINAEIREDF